MVSAPPHVRHHGSSTASSRRVNTVSSGQRYGMMVSSLSRMYCATILPLTGLPVYLAFCRTVVKKQMAMAHPATPPQALLPLSFVEVPTTPPWPSPPMATQVELHRADGARLCIHNPEATLPLTALVHAFLEASSCCS